MEISKTFEEKGVAVKLYANIKPNDDPRDLAYEDFYVKVYKDGKYQQVLSENLPKILDVLGLWIHIVDSVDWDTIRHVQRLKEPELQD